VTERTTQATAGAVGGSRNEQGAELRARVGALVGSAVIAERPLDEVGLAVAGAVGVAVAAEGDDAVDDLVVPLRDGGHVFIQVKTSARLSGQQGSPFEKVVAQFARAVRVGVHADDRLVLACARCTKPLVELGRLLERERYPRSGGPTAREQQALDALRLIALRHLDDEGFAALRARLVIWETDPTAGDGHAALVARMESWVCERGEGADAARELGDVVRHLARLRGGLDALGLAQALAARDVVLRNDVSGSPVAAARAVVGYQRLQKRRGRTLSLFNAPAGLAGLPLSAADARVDVDVAGEDLSSGRHLELAQRRRGRCVLTGRPGGGKSTALRALCAHAAERSDWPLPMLVSLKRLGTGDRPLGERLLDLVCEEVPAQDRSALRRGLESELSAGRVLLMLDGLDEVRKGRVALVDELAAWIEDLPAEVELILATRASAIEQARRLGLDELSLRVPDQPEDTVRAILEAAAPNQGAAAESWVEERAGWIGDAMARDGLGFTPLTVVTLALIAARSDDVGALPKGRAEILLRALQDVMETWEIEQRNRGDIALGPLRDRSARDGLAVTLRTLAGAVIGGEPLSPAATRQVLGSALGREFTLRDGDLRVAVDDSLMFWTDIGLFSFEDDQLNATLRPLAEVAYAWSGELAQGDEQEIWLSLMRSSQDTWTTLALAAGLSEAIAHRWVEELAVGGGVDELEAFAQASRDGVKVEASVLATLAGGSVRRMLAEPREAERAALAVLGLPLDDTARANLRPLLSAVVPRERTGIVETLTIAAWDETGKEANQRLREFLAAEKPPPRDPPKPGAGVLELITSSRDDAYQRAFEAASVRLAEGSREDAELVASRFDDGSLDFRRALEAALQAGGNDDLAETMDLQMKAALAKWGSHWNGWIGTDFAEHERSVLQAIASLGDPGALDWSQRRHLDELADLASTASLNWIRPGFIAERPAEAESWIRAVASLGNFELPTLCSQARLVIDEMAAGEETNWIIYDHGRDRPLRCWERVEDSERLLSGLVDCIGLLPQQAGGALLEAIGSTPDRSTAVRLLERRIERLRIWARELAALLLLVVADDGDSRAEGWVNDDDPMLRSAAAEWFSAHAANGHDVWRQLARCLHDSDEGVRKRALSHFHVGELTSAQREAIEALPTLPRQPWMCRNCGAENEAGRDSCIECSVVDPELAKRVEELLCEPT
jgi:hypothetical protein